MLRRKMHEIAVYLTSIRQIKKIGEEAIVFGMLSQPSSTGGAQRRASWERDQFANSRHSSKTIRCGHPHEVDVLPQLRAGMAAGIFARTHIQITAV